MSDEPRDYATDNAIGRIGERLARVETQQEAVKEDTRTIRGAQHDMRGEMQKFVIAEQRMTTAIESLAREQSKAQVEITAMASAIRGLAEITSTFMSMKTDLVNLVEEQHKRIGAWGLATKTGAVVVGLLTAVGSVLAILAYFIHFDGKTP
jgi:chromosome segregation ATPase